MKPAAALAIVVGAEITHDPLLGPGLALIRASASHRRWVAAKRALGKG